MNHSRGYLMVVMLLGLLLNSTTAWSQAWPNKPITIVVVFAPGGTADFVARTVAVKLSAQLGQQVVIENRPGAGGTVGATAVARAKPDGYTLLSLVSSHAVSETLFKNRPYDLQKDFAPVGSIGTSPYWLLVNPETTKAGTMKEFTASLQAQPGKYSYASGGSGGLTHLSSEMMKMQGKLDVVHIPFKGNGPALTELMAGRVAFLIDQPASSEAFIKAGKLKPLAVTSPTRMPTHPDIPTMAESGFPGFSTISFIGLAYPASTPKEIVERMNRELNIALAAPDVKKQLETAGITPTPISTNEFSTLISNEIRQWRAVIEKSNITAD